MGKDWRSMPGPGDPETWGPCQNHPNDPRTPDDTDRFESVRERMIESRMKKVDWFREALSEADDEQMLRIMAAVDSGIDKDLDKLIGKIVREYVEPNDWEVGEQIELEDEPDDRI